MADAVQMLLEEMVPELQGFVEHGVLSKAEVRALVKKRTDFEYRLRRRAAERRDFERYIEYERTFEQLLKARRARLGAEKGKAAAKFSCVKHIHFIFDRAVKKFRGDIALWLEWIDYAKSEQSSKVLSKIFARALQLHPRNAQLWVHAAAYEWDSGNVTASRTLLQRGIRLNNKSADLWREYFRMEVLFTARLAERRRVLGLGKGAKAPAAEVAGSGAAISIGELDEEGKAVSDGVALPDTPSADAGLEELLAGSIPRAVVRYARETMGSNPELFFAMYDLCYLGGDSARRQLEDEILAVIDDIAASPPPPASSVASSESAAAAVENATAAAVTGCATRRAARAMAESAAAGSEGAAVCDAAQDVLDKYLSPYCSAAGAPLSPKTSPRKSAKGSKGQKLADRSAGPSAGVAPAASVPDIPGDGSKKGHNMLAAAMWQAACGFWAEVEKQAKGKGSAASAGRNHELAKEAGARASQMLAAARQQGIWTEVIALESIKRILKAGRAGTAGDAASAKAGGGKGKGKRLANSAQGSEKDAGAEALGIAKQALEHLPGNVNVAAEYLRLASTAMMVRAGGEGERDEEEALTSLAATVDQVLKTCGKAPGAHKLWTDRVQLQVGRSADTEPLVAIFVSATNACPPEEAAQVLLAGLAAVDEAHGHGPHMLVGRALLSRPLPQAVKSALVQTLTEGLLARCKAEEKQGGGRGSQIAELRVLMEMWAAEETAKGDHELWLRWEQAERAVGDHKRATGVHWRALRTLTDADEYNRLRALDSKD